MMSLRVFLSRWRSKPLYMALLIVAGHLPLGCNSPTPQKSSASPETAQTSTAPQKADSKSASGRSPEFLAWLNKQYESELQFSPITLTFLGRKELNDQLGDFSVEEEKRQLEWRKKSVDTMVEKFDYNTLSDADKLSYDLWKYQYEQRKAGEPFLNDGYFFHQMMGVHSQLPNLLINFHGVDSRSDLEAYISRINLVRKAFGQLLDRAQDGVDRGIKTPGFALEIVIKESKAIISGQPFSGKKDSDIWSDINREIKGLIDAKKISEKEAQELRGRAKTALLENFKPTYEQLISWAKTQLKTAPKRITGIGSQPNGKAYYAHLLANQTTTSLTPDEVHSIGLSEVARIRGEMESIMKQVDFKGTLSEFFQHVLKADWNYYPNTDEGRQAYIDDASKALKNIQQKLPEYFGLLPKAELVVKRVESFREQDGAAQHYYPSTPDGSRPGVYYAHLSDMSAMPKNQLEVIAYHEGLPGHHMQIAIAQELKGVPTFQTQAQFTAYMEGWALYSELLAKEIPGTYADAYSDFGRLTTEIWRAIRLVVDTGLHAKGWTREQAIKYFSENSPEPLESITSEVQRYLVIPGQATSYKIGMLKIIELRKAAEAELGDRFSLPKFHDQVLSAGALPLNLLERRINQWVVQIKSEPSHKL